MEPSSTTANTVTSPRRYTWLDYPPAAIRATEPPIPAQEPSWLKDAVASFQEARGPTVSRFYYRGVARVATFPFAWQDWSPEVRQFVHRKTWQKAWEKMTLCRFTRDKAIMQNDHVGWFLEANPEEHVKGKIFLSPTGTSSLLQCERCCRVFDHNMRPVAPSTYPAGLQTFQVTLALCPFNENGQCHADRAGPWKDRVTAINRAHYERAEKAMRALSWVDPRELIGSVFGQASCGITGRDQLFAAYQAIRIIWLRAFPALRPVPSEESPDNQATHDQAKVDQANSSSSIRPPRHYYEASLVPKSFSQKLHQLSGQIADPEAVKLFHRFGDPSLWGDVELDLVLLKTYPDLLEERHLAQVYGIGAETLRYMLREKWQDEMEWLGAYAGMRHSVPNDHYMLMRTACQRASTAMERVLEALEIHARIIPKTAKTYAWVGRRFHELLSALCADISVARHGLRAIDQPLQSNLWKTMSREWAGRRVDPLLVE